MRIYVKTLSAGLGPGEVVVEVETASGSTEQVIMHSDDILEEDTGETIEVGYPIHSSKNKSLVELPSESISGRWRVWVPSSVVIA
jgi:hypothetical protein